MKQRMAFAELGRTLLAGFCIAALSCPQQAHSCAGSIGPACALNPSACLKSMSLAKSAATGMGLVTFSPGTLTLTFTLSATCPSCPTTPCATPATPTAASLSMAGYFLADFAVFPPPPCPAVPPPGAPAFTDMTAVALPACTPAGASTDYTVSADVPGGLTEGYYCLFGTATITFSDGMTLTASGDTVICVVPPVPGQPGVPRLSITLLSESAPRAAAGDSVVARYIVRNNDLSNAVQLTAFAGSRQSALRPQGGNERQGVFSISAPFGDDFPIQFDPADCVPLPEHPYTQRQLSNSIPLLPPGGSNIITVGMRSYGQCANGSCSEGTLAVIGMFPDGQQAAACAGMALIVDNSMPSSACATAVNDCNNNGIPDALDIASGRSQDRNFNAMPDECEEFISIPTSTSVNPTDPAPGAPIVVRVAFNETVPMSNVWANGIPLTRMGPFWQGTIPADTRPGPQTVYFLGKDQAGALATHIATYNVQVPPTVVSVPQGCSSIADNYVASPDNRLSVVLSNAVDETQIYKWNSAAQTYDVFTRTLGLWEPSDTTLAPGEGAFIFSPVAQTFTFSGQIGPAPPRPRLSPGSYLVSCRTPALCAFDELMGFPPSIGDKVIKYDNATPDCPTQPSSMHEFTAAGWSPSPPALDVGKAAFVELVTPVQPVITGVSPLNGVSGDVITISGRGFGSDPDDLCVGLMADPPVAMRALSATDTRITARIGAVPSNAVPGRISVMVGQGNRDLFEPVLDGIEVVNNWTWQSRATPAISTVTVTPVFVPPDPGVRWFFGEVANSNLCIYLSGDWDTNARVWVEVHLFAGGVWYDQQTCDILQGSGTTLDCANKLKDIVVCGLQQGQGVLLPADVEQLPDGTVKITLHGPDNQPITSGSISVCTTPPRVPIITGVSPSEEVITGDIITITGSGFGNNPNNICVMAVSPMIPPKPWDPLRVLSATDTRITARLGTVPPPMAGMPSPVIMVQLGEGNVGPFTPIFPSIKGGQDTWVWTSREPAAQAPGTFQTVYTPPGAGQQYFFGQITNGVICIYISGNWVTNARVTVEMHFNAGDTHYDLQERTVTFENGGTALECAQLIKDLIVCAFGQRGGVLLPADVEEVSADLVKVTIRSPNNEPITSGMLTICCLAPRVPVITAVSPSSAGEGEVVTILGRNFGNDPNNLCVVARTGDTAVPLRAFSASETQILARVGITATDIGPTRIMVGLGEGNAGRFVPAFPDLIVEDEAWVWRGFDQGVLAPDQFVAVPSAPRFGVQWFEGQVVDGRLCTFIRGNWASNVLVQITARAHTDTEKLDLEAPRTRFLGAGTTLQCALRMKDIIQCAFLQQAGANVNVEVEELADGSVKITVSRADGQPIVWGLLTICVSKPVTFPEEFPVHMNINISQPCKPGPGDILIDRMVDRAGNVVELRCVNGMYLLYFIRPGQPRKIIGKCIYPWGENAGWKFLDHTGNIQKVVWYNYEGHSGHDNNNPIHDTNGDGRENRDCYIYDVATDTLTVRKDDRGLNQNVEWLGQANPALEWEIQRVSNPRPAPSTLPALDLLFADLVGPALPDGDYDAQMPALQFFGTIEGGGEVVVSVNHYPLIVPTMAGMTPAQLARQVADQFNQRWQQDQTQQGQQRQQQGKTATNDLRYEHIVDFRNALQEELQVTILGESNLFFNEFSYPDQSVRRQRSPARHKNVNIAEPCLPEPGNKQISIMTDNAGNSVELRCENGSYHLYFIRPDATRTVIGQCIYLWGENAGWKNLDAHGNFTAITWYNYEGHHEHNNNECVHDSGHNPGKENRDCYIYDVVTDRLKIRKECRPLSNCRSDPRKPWQMISMTGWRRGPRTLQELHELFSDVVDADLPNGNYDAQTSSVEFRLRQGGQIRGGGHVVVTINDFPVIVQTVSNITTAQLASQVSQQFNQQWQQNQSQQGQQQQQQGKSAAQDTNSLHVVDFRNVILEELRVAIIDEPDLTTELPCDITLSVARDGNVVIIQWEGGGVLQCTPSLTGPIWADVAGNPVDIYTTPATEPAKFFRVFCPDAQ